MCAEYRSPGPGSMPSSSAECMPSGGRAEASSCPTRSLRKSASTVALSPAATAWPCFSTTSTRSVGTPGNSVGVTAPPRVARSPERPARLGGGVGHRVLHVGLVVHQSDAACLVHQGAVLGVDRDHARLHAHVPEPLEARDEHGAHQRIVLVLDVVVPRDER